MIQFMRLVTTVLVLAIANIGYGQTFNTDPFNKVIISPYIEATFIEGDQERVVINSTVVDASKLHVETKNGTLRVYLDGAKELPRNEKEDRRNSHPLYPKTAVSATIYYRKLDALSLRGEETFAVNSPVRAKHFNLKLYGESALTFSEVQIDQLQTEIYGESSVELKAGSVNKQSYTCYGAGRIDATTISSAEATLIAYGETEFNMNVSDRIKITSFGEARLRYKGNAQIVKGINIGDVDVAKMD